MGPIHVAELAAHEGIPVLDRRYYITHHGHTSGANPRVVIQGSAAVPAATGPARFGVAPCGGEPGVCWIKALMEGAERDCNASCSTINRKRFQRAAICITICP